MCYCMPVYQLRGGKWREKRRSDELISLSQLIIKQYDGAETSYGVPTEWSRFCFKTASSSSPIISYFASNSHSLSFSQPTSACVVSSRGTGCACFLDSRGKQLLSLSTHISLNKCDFLRLIKRHIRKSIIKVTGWMRL